MACHQGKWAARHQAAVEGDRVARITRVTLVDDLDGGEASETVYFSFEGRHYEIDLTAQNAAKLRDSLAPFVAAARRRDGARRSRTARADPGPTPSGSDRVKGAEIREWARQHGHKIAIRGRIPRWILEAYRNEVG